MIESGYIVAAILAMALVTFSLRALPFVAAQWLRKHPMGPGNAKPSSRSTMQRRKRLTTPAIKFVWHS